MRRPHADSSMEIDDLAKYIRKCNIDPRVSAGYEEYLKRSSRSTVTHLADGSEAGARFDEQDSVVTRWDRQATHWVNATAAESFLCNHSGS